MKTKLLFIVLLVFISLNSFKGEKDGQSKTQLLSASIEGVVVDELSGETLAGVEVSIEGTNLKTYTDFDGNFTFGNISVGEYSICAKLVSYKEVHGKKINSSNENILKLEMNFNN